MTRGAPRADEPERMVGGAVVINRDPGSAREFAARSERRAAELVLDYMRAR